MATITITDTEGREYVVKIPGEVLEVVVKEGLKRKKSVMDDYDMQRIMTTAKAWRPADETEPPEPRRDLSSEIYGEIEQKLRVKANDDFLRPADGGAEK